jgi:uncharacterized protein (TIGR02099 family)
LISGLARAFGGLLRGALSVAVLLLMLLALYVSVGRELTPLVAEYQAEVEARAQQALGMPVRIGRLSGGWQRFAPVLLVHDVSLGEQSSVVHLEQVRVIPDVLASLLAGQIMLADLQVDGLRISLREGVDGQWHLDGLPAQAESSTPAVSPGVLLAGLQRVGWLSLLNSQITLQPQGQAPLSLTYVNLSLRSIGTRQRLDGRLVLPDGQPLAWRLRTRLHPAEWAKAEAELYLSAPMSDWARWLPASLTAGWQADKLQLGGEFWLSWANGTVQRAVAQVHAPQLRGAYAQRKPVELTDMTVNAYYQRSDSGFALQLDSLAASLGATRWGDVHVGLEYQAEDTERQERWRLSADRLDLTPLAPVIKALAPLPESITGWLDGLAPRGALRNLQLAYRPQAPADQQVQFSANLERIAVNAYEGVPGLGNISGSISGDLGRGELRLAADDFILDLDALFAKPWHYQQAHALLNWTLTSQELTLSSAYMRLDGSEGRLAGDMMIRLPFAPEADSYMDLRVGIQQGDARYTEKYLPTRSGGVSPELATWLTTAIRAGQVDEGFFQYQGALAPTAPANSSSISLYFKVRDVELAYQPGWPELRKAAGAVLIDERGVRVQVSQGQVLNSTLTSVAVNIPTPAKGGITRLALNGALQSSVADGLQILQTAPIGTQATFAGWQGQGPLSGQLKLDLPLEGKDPPVVQVDFATEGAQLKITEPALSLTQLKGAFRFNSASGLSSPDVRAQVFGRPLRGKIVAEGARGRTRTRVEANGQLALKSLTDWLAISQPLPLKGELPYRLRLTLDGDDSQLQVDSTLKGLAIDLPPPFGKSASEARYADWRMTLQGKERRYWFSYEDLASLALAAPAGALLEGRGELLLGKGTASLPTRKGLGVRGSLSALDLDAWQALSKRYLPEQTGARPDMLASIALQIGRFQGFGVVLNSVDAQLTRGAASWLLKLDSDLVTGQLTLPDAPGATLVAALQRLQLPAADPAVSTTATALDPLATVDPRSIPAVDLSIAQVLRGAEVLGAWSVQARPRPTGVRLSELSIDLKGLLVTGALNWDGAAGATQSSFKGRIGGKDLADVLTAWGYAPSAVSESFRVDSDVQWPGSPAAFSMRELSGSLDVSLKKGQFLEVKGGSGAALRVFGLLNFNSLGRRLRLDFSDLTDKGLAFDSVKGVLQGTNGNFVTTTPVTLSGASTIVVDGKVNLRQQTLDTSIRVTLPLASNLPLAALAIGAPAIGGAIFVADKLFGGRVSSLTSVEYRAQGSMDDPQITFVKPF